VMAARVAGKWTGWVSGVVTGREKL
jgi:hypothetical protein